VTNDKLRPADYRFVERLLYEQKTHATAMAEIQAELDDLMTPCSSSIIFDFELGGSGEGSHPENNAISRFESVKGKTLRDEICVRERHHKAINEAVEKLSDCEAQLIRLKYNLEKSSRECMQIMGYEKSHFYRMKNEVVTKVGRFLGL